MTFPAMTQTLSCRRLVRSPVRAAGRDGRQAPLVSRGGGCAAAASRCDVSVDGPDLFPADGPLAQCSARLRAHRRPALSAYSDNKEAAGEREVRALACGEGTRLCVFYELKNSGKLLICRRAWCVPETGECEGSGCPMKTVWTSSVECYPVVWTTHAPVRPCCTPPLDQRCSTGVPVM